MCVCVFLFLCKCMSDFYRTPPSIMQIFRKCISMFSVIPVSTDKFQTIALSKHEEKNLFKSIYCFICYQLLMQIRKIFEVTFSGHSINMLSFFLQNKGKNNFICTFLLTFHLAVRMLLLLSRFSHVRLCATP